MRAVRDVWAELVERRLWPVALLLVAALVAVPVVLAKQPSAEPAATATDVPPAAAAAAADLRSGEPVVSVARDAAADAPLRGRAKNPFKQQHVPPPVTGADGAPAGGVLVPGSGGDGSGGAGTGGGGGQGAPPKTYTYASIDVRFGKAASPLRELHDVPRLTPLPGAAQPIVVFMGMRADHETAVFLVSTDVHAQGEGRCVPSKKLCEAIELKRDEIALLDWAEPDGSVTQYELDLVDVTLHQTTSKALASRAYARTSRAGARFLEALVHSSSNVAPRRKRMPFRYAARSGVLHIAPWASRSARAARAHGAISTGRLADLTPAGR